MQLLACDVPGGLTSAPPQARIIWPHSHVTCAAGPRRHWTSSPPTVTTTDTSPPPPHPPGCPLPLVYDASSSVYLFPTVLCGVLLHIGPRAVLSYRCIRRRWTRRAGVLLACWAIVL